MKCPQSIVIVPRGLGKSPAFDRLDIANPACSSADFLGTGLPSERSKHEPDKAIRNPAPYAAAIPSWPANPGLCSSHAVGALSQKFPATSPFSCATFSPANRSSFCGGSSPTKTVRRRWLKYVFTHTQTKRSFYIFRLAVGTRKAGNSST